MVPIPIHPFEEALPVPDPLAVQVTVEAFYHLLEDTDLYEAFAEFIVPAGLPSAAPC